MKNLDGLDVIYWINLDRSPEREQSMREIFNDEAFYDIDRIRFSAVDGKNDNIDDMITVDEKTMSLGEYGCLLSHFEVIREFSKSTYDVALVLEDDATLDFKPYWKKSLKDVADNAPPDWEIIMLSYISNDIPEEEYTLDKNKYWSTIAYIINKKGARRFIDKYYKNNKYIIESGISHEADQYIYQKIVTYVYKYPFFIYKYNENSTLHQGAVSRHDESRKRIDEMYERMSQGVEEGFSTGSNYYGPSIDFTRPNASSSPTKPPIITMDFVNYFLLFLFVVFIYGFFVVFGISKYFGITRNTKKSR
jgi:GR25 family glycosyltransferase involved in LPS biosynthesis